MACEKFPGLVSDTSRIAKQLLKYPILISIIHKFDNIFMKTQIKFIKADQLTVFKLVY